MPASTPSGPVLRVEKNEGIATLTLDRPDAMNALSRRLREELVAAFEALAADDDVEVIILTGAGERAFCAGLDLKELGGEETAAGASDSAEESGSALGVVGGGADIIAAMAACDRPIIGAINGYAITGGFELALACDVLVASEHACFADTHARVGILPGWGLSQKLPRLVGIHRAKELSLTGNFLDARTAADWGIVGRVVPAGELLETCRSLARDMQSCVPGVMRRYKALIDDGFAETLGEGLRREGRASALHAREVGAEAIALRRREIQERGRSQTR